MRLYVLLCILWLSRCHGVIYHLNDSEYARMPRLYELDNYDSCLSQVDGLYCVAKFNLYPGRANELIRLIEEYSAYTSKHYNYSRIERGICVTKTCKQFAAMKNLTSTVDLHATIETCVNESIWNEYHLEAKVSDVLYCNKPNDQPNVDISDLIVALVFVAFILSAVIGSFYDIYYNKTEEDGDNTNVNKLLLNFSLRKNWRKLVKPEAHDPKRNILKGLHGIRSITTFFIPLGHVIIINSMGFIDQPYEFEKTYDTIFSHLIYNGLVIVQVFFFMSAFLQAYHILIYSETEPVTLSHLPKLLLARWFRLTPAYAVVIAFTATWMRHVGSGPLWRLYVNDSVVAQCRRFWWLHLIYFNNYQPEDTFCALHTWHIAADTQLFVVGMLIYLATMSHGRTLALSLMMLVGMAAPAVHVYLQDFNGLVQQSPEFYRIWSDKSFHHLHVFGHNNISCYVIGLATGTLVYNWQKKKLDFSKYKRWGALSWFIIPAIGCLFLSGRLFYAEGERASLGIRVLYAGTQRAVMGLLVAAGVISLTMKLNKNFCSLFEWNGWLVPSKLSYSVYLLHMNLAHILLALRTQLGHVSTLNLLVNYCGVVTLSVMMAVPFYLLVEAPMSGLLVLYLKSRTNIAVVKNGKKVE